MYSSKKRQRIYTSAYYRTIGYGLPGVIVKGEKLPYGARISLTEGVCFGEELTVGKAIWSSPDKTTTLYQAYNMSPAIERHRRRLKEKQENLPPVPRRIYNSEKRNFPVLVCEVCGEHKPLTYSVDIQMKECRKCHRGRLFWDY